MAFVHDIEVLMLLYQHYIWFIFSLLLIYELALSSVVEVTVFFHFYVVDLNSYKLNLTIYRIQGVCLSI